MSARIIAACFLLALVGCESLIGLEDRTLVDAQADGGDGPDADAGNTARADGGDAARADAGEGDTSSELCREYCAEVTKACTGDYAVYSSEALCLQVCAELPEGDAPEGNTVMCRLEVARFITEPAADCPAAGPGGAGRCGENCESYCGLLDRVCEEYRSPNVQRCIEQCAALRDRDKDPGLGPDESRFEAESSTSRDHNGDTVQCRLFHVSAASAPLGASAHCWHAQLAPRPLEGSTNPCLGEVDQVEPRCEDYCRIIAVACSGSDAVYESEAQCLAVCEAMPIGELADSGGQNTLGCRATHAYNALVGDPVTHCPHAGPSGSSVCGDDCESYCAQLSDACSDGFAEQYGDDPRDANASCVSDCAELLEGEAKLQYAVADERIDELPELGCLVRAVARAQETPTSTQCQIALGLSDCQ